MHVWRVPLDAHVAHEVHVTSAHAAVLSDDEQRRVARFMYPAHARRYTIAHGMLRHILARYTGRAPSALRFAIGAHGKPTFARDDDQTNSSLHFNLSHSNELALIAVSTTGPVGVDLEFWRPRIQHVAVAERFFSVRERAALAASVDEQTLVTAFFTAWSRKEAYLKATGHGISRGLHHFDVTVAPHLPAEILEDRLDASATERWALANIDVAPRYSAALVAARPFTVVEQFHAPVIELPI